MSKPVSNEYSSAILSSEKRFELLVTSISDYAIYLLDPNGQIVSWNAGAQRFKGYTQAEILGKHFSLFFTEEDLVNKSPWKILEQAAKVGRFEAEGWRVRKDGARFWANVVVDAIYDDEKNLIGFAKITRDITESKKAQDALYASEEQFRYLVQGVTDYAIYMLSPEGIVINWNSGAERIKGYTAEEIIGQHYRRFLPPEDVEAGLPEIALNTAKLEGRYEHEGWRLRKDGSRFRAHVIIDAIYNDDKNLIGFAKITRDITERYKTEETLAKANAALFQSQKMDAIGKLTGGIAHDFNNLLSVISTGLEVFGLGALDSRQVKMVESMKRAIDRGATLTQKLLSFARQQPLTAKAQNINKLINSFEPLLLKASNSSIKFKMNLTADIIPIKIDANGFETALLNLIVNSRDAMPNGGAITVMTEKVRLASHDVGSLNEGVYIKVSVEDTGEGISSEVMPHILEPFFTTKEIGKGTGLGLSQVYGFMMQSGGDIAFDSEPGKGATVSLYFPVIEDSDEIVELTEIEDLKVLIVDDEPDLIITATELFRNMGYTVLAAHSAEDAIDRLWHYPGISVLFTDILMPGGMNGIQLAREVRQMNPDIKIILASGYPLPALREEHGNMDEFNFINKPYRLADIARCLRAPDVTHELAHS
ncbi:MAG: hybrid sensor histidine kinase/response regulator [Methylotenera sp.]|nr:MAG: hybrid sensor histidine kinase/response regulator [Methylotenera sp.]